MNLKKILTTAGILAFFVLVAYVFVPQVLQHKVVDQSDGIGWRGMATEALLWNKDHPDDPAQWSDSMFGGMPTITFAAQTKGDWTQKIYNLSSAVPRPANFLLISLLGAFLMLLAFGIHPLLAAGGAVAVTFCAYNLQIIQVGHNTKMLAIAFSPWVIAAFVFTLRSAVTRKKWLPLTVLGAALFGLSLSFQLKSCHPQISYYLAIILIIFAIVELVWVCRDSARRKALLGRLFAAAGLLVVLGVCGMATNAVKYFPTFEYTQHSIRGGSSDKSSDSAAKGLDLQYATAWSYGAEELPNLMVPNFNGGSSNGPLDPKKSAIGKFLRRSKVEGADEICSQLPLYWGPQPFTSGPMYMGAITIFLFLMGLFCYKGRERWWALAATVLAVLLSLGNHLMWFTKFFYDCVPFYNKFRSVSMSLVVLQTTLPVLGFLMLDRIVRDTSRTPAQLRSMLLKSGGVTVGLCLLLSLLQWLTGSFTSSSDSSMSQPVVAALVSDRISLLWKDTLRTVLLVVGAAAVLVWGVSVPGKAKENFESDPAACRGRRMTAALLVCLLVLVDLFSVGKRYLNDSHFVSPHNFENHFAPRSVDVGILKDTTVSYRVLDLTSDCFQSSIASIFHKSIGGYSAAKLQIYQEFIESTLQNEVNSLMKSIGGCRSIEEAEAAMPYLPGLAALNLKYVILSDDLAIRYRHGNGPAWFEDMDKGFIKMDSYSPNRLEYHYSSIVDQRAVFSEVYYPSGWTLTLDDGTEVPVELYSGDGDVPGGVLRSAVLPMGTHTLTMSYDQPAYHSGVAVSRACSILLVAIVLLSAAFAVYSSARKKEEEI